MPRTTDAPARLRSAPAALAVVLTVALLPLSDAASASTSTAEAATKTVRYHGVSVAVPQEWPVQRMSGRPGCVRFDRSAVYLGDPTRSTCPPHLVGRIAAVHLTTKSLHGVTAPDRVVTSSQSPVDVLVTAGPDDSTAADIAGSVRFRSGRTHTLSPTDASGARTLARVTDTSTSPATTYSASSRTMTASRAASATEAAFAATTFTGQGFDACTARSVAELATWYQYSPYKAVNMYIGGASRGCSQPNLNADWVKAVVAQGWVLIPTYVGLQAPCRDYPNRIDPANAAAQGRAGADDAITALNLLGLGGGNPVYFDMEAFNYANTGCRQAVLTFLDAWTERLHARGYVSGVYGSAESTIRALVSQLTNTAFDQPDHLWIARWCQTRAGCDTSTNDPEVPVTEWDDHQRIRQYLGGHQETYGGVTINIDSNTVDAAVSPSQLAPDGSFVTVTGTSDLYRVAGGAPIYTSSWASVGLPPQPVTQLSPTQFASMPDRPRTGTFLVGGATGRVFRVSGGIARHVPSWAPYGGPQPAIVVDQAALDNAGTGGVWNHLASGKPTVRTTPVDRGTLTGKQRFGWRPGVVSSAVKNYDVRWKRARWNGGYSAWKRPANWQRTRVVDVPLGMRKGYTYCVSVRARNRANQLSGWSGSRCSARALDDRSLIRSSGWKARSGSKYYSQTYLKTFRKGAKLSRPNAKVKRVGVVATTCRRCGVVIVRVDGKKVGRVNLASPVVKRRQVLMLPAFPRERGTVTLTVRSRDKKVQIDGLVLNRG